MRSFLVLIFAVAFGIALTICVGAQGVGFSGTIKGTVIDANNAVVPNVLVTISDTGTGFRRAISTDDRGQFLVTGLSPTTYNVRAELKGFQPELRKEMNLTIGQVLVVDFQLKVSSVNTDVEVTSEPPLVDTGQSQQANTIGERYIRDLPINRRDYLSYTLLAPAVSDSTRIASDQDYRVKQTPQSGLSFYGSNGRGNNVTVDGGETNDDSGGVRGSLSQDAVQEFQINRSNYTAEMGGASGAAINIVSKSGTNEPHGSAFGYFRNNVLDARNPFSYTQALQSGQTFNPAVADSLGVPIKDKLNRQQFGGSAGFAIKPDRSFLFLAFEGLNQNAQNSVPLLTNTNIFRPNTGQNAIISGLAGLGATPVPCLTGQPALPAATCAAILTNILTINPATSPLNTYVVNQFENNGGIFPYGTKQYMASGRFDTRIGDNNQMFFRYNYVYDSENNPDVQSLTGFSRGSGVKGVYHTAELAWFHEFSPKITNELRVQYSYMDFKVTPNFNGQVGLDVPGFGNFGNQIFIPSRSVLRRYEFADNVSWVNGPHILKFGFYELIRANNTESHTFFPGRFVFGNLPGGVLSPCLQVPAACGLAASTSPAAVNAIQSLSLGLPQFYQQGFGSPNLARDRPYTAFFVQDAWNITKNFTLNLGVRYEYDSQYGTLRTDPNDISPRVAFSWDPFKDHKTVIRGGYGIFYSQVYAQIANVIQTLGNINGRRQISNYLVPLTGVPGNPALTSAAIFQTLFAQGVVQCTTAPVGSFACIRPSNLTQFGINVTNTGPIPPLTVLFQAQSNYQNPQSQQMEIGIEREIVNGFSISGSYIHVHTIHLPVAIDINLLPAPFAPAGPAGVLIRQWGSPACQVAVNNPCFVSPLILQNNQYSSIASALYDGFIFEFKGRLSNTVSLFGSYTLSRAKDDATDFNSDYSPQDQTNFAAERALSDFDQRHKIVIAGVIQAPRASSDSGLLAKFVSGFELSPIFRYNSSHPFNLLAGTNVNNDNHSTNDRPPGAGRNTGIGPDYFDVDMRLSRRFSIGEKANIEVLAEGFNLFNRTNYGSVNNVVGVIAGPFNLTGDPTKSPSSPLGFTSALPKRQFQIGAKFTF